MTGDFDLPGALRRIRRMADLSQRDLAAQLGLSPAVVARAESGTRPLPVAVLARAASLAGLRLALLDAAGGAVEGMVDETVRDFGGRRFPAHLDTRHADEGWWHDAHHWSRPQAWYTFDLDRGRRDARRAGRGTPHDHQLSQPGDSPTDRRAARRRALREQAEAEWQRRLAAEEVAPLEPFVCTCPPACDELDDWSGKPLHADGCPCGCDLG